VLKRDGIDVRGPAPADTLFHAAARATYDAALCMYHDQALIPIKTVDFAGGVNVTLGLPYVRTSPDHGTALDIAGTAAPTRRASSPRCAWRTTWPAGVTPERQARDGCARPACRRCARPSPPTVSMRASASASISCSTST